MNRIYENVNSTLTINNCIEIDYYKGTIKYIGTYYKSLPEWLQILEDKLQRSQNLKAFI
jgi:hypothetical protein